ncbi:MAG: DUF2190 family protein [bacterium]
MAQNKKSDGKVITITASATLTGGNPIRVNKLNGVVLSNAVSGDSVAVAVEGVFELVLASVSAGGAIYIDETTGALAAVTGVGKHFFGRALTASGTGNKFQCRLQQNTDA